MEHGYKTLILVDNSASVSIGNREIVKETLKYLIKNAPGTYDFALATYTGQTELLVNYGSAKEDYLDAVDKITYVEKVTCLPDVVMHTVDDWRDADFAMRSILVFTDGLGTGSDTYPIEEVYFRLNESAYPLYVIGLSQQTNEMPLRTAASMARISHGAFFPTDFEDSEAEVERKLSEQVFAAMQKAIERAEKEEEEERVMVAEDETAAETAAVSEEYEQPENLATYEEEISAGSLTRAEHGAILYGALGTGVLAVILLLLVLIRYLGRSKRKQAEPDVESRVSRIREITLEDLNDPMRFFHMPASERIVIGSDRAEADVTIDHDEDVSDRHCEIAKHGERYFIRDLKSDTGTILNGEKLLSETELHSADVIMVGRAKLMIRMLYAQQ